MRNCIRWTEKKYLVTDASLTRFLVTQGLLASHTGDIREAQTFPALETARNNLELWYADMCRREGLDRVIPVEITYAIENDEPNKGEA